MAPSRREASVVHGSTRRFRLQAFAAAPIAAGRTQHDPSFAVKMPVGFCPFPAETAEHSPSSGDYRKAGAGFFEEACVGPLNIGRS